ALNAPVDAIADIVGTNGALDHQVVPASPGDAGLPHSCARGDHLRAALHVAQITGSHPGDPHLELAFVQLDIVAELQRVAHIGPEILDPDIDAACAAAGDAGMVHAAPTPTAPPYGSGFCRDECDRHQRSEDLLHLEAIGGEGVRL